MGDITANFGAVSIVPKARDGEKYRKFKIAACGGFHYALICRTYSVLSTSAPALGLEPDGDLNDINGPAPGV